MPSYRVLRAQEDVARELSVIFRSMKDPRVSKAMLSIVKLDLSKDLSSCKIYVSSMNGFEASTSAVQALKKASGFIRHELALRVQLRISPELYFIADDSIAHSADINELLQKLGEKSHEN